MSPVTTALSPKERIKRTMAFEAPDRIGIYDMFTDEAVRAWRSQGLSTQKRPGDYFEHDIEIIRLDAAAVEDIDTTKFVCLAVDDPFSRLCRAVGLEHALRKMAYEAREVTKTMSRITDSIIEEVSSWVTSHRGVVDAVWLYGDLAYQKGLFFSVDYYRRLLFPLHRELCGVFASDGLDIIFHSDGDLRELLPLLIGAGIRAVEPLETDAGIDSRVLRKEFGRDLVLFGNITYTSLVCGRAGFEREVAEKLDYFRQTGGYVYRLDKEVTADISLDDYMFALETVKRYGGR